MNKNKTILIAALWLMFFPILSSAVELETSDVSANGQFLALAHDDNVIRVFSLENGQLLHTLRSHSDSIQTVSFNHDGSRLLSGSWGEYVILWDIKTGQVLKKKKMPETVMHAYFSANGENIILSIDEVGLFIYDAKISKKPHRFDVNDKLKISQNKEFLIGQNDDGVSIIDLKNKELLFNAPENAYDSDMYFSKDNTLVVIRDSSSFHVWNIKDETKVHTIDAIEGTDTAALRTVTNELWIGNNNKIEIHNYLTSKPMAILSFEELNIDEVQHITFSDNGKTAAITVKLEDKSSQIIILNTSSYEIKHLISPASFVWPGTQFINNELLFLQSTYPSEVWDLNTQQKKFSFTELGTEQ